MKNIKLLVMLFGSIVTCGCGKAMDIENYLVETIKKFPNTTICLGQEGLPRMAYYFGKLSQDLKTSVEFLSYASLNGEQMAIDSLACILKAEHESECWYSWAVTNLSTSLWIRSSKLIEQNRLGEGFAVLKQIFEFDPGKIEAIYTLKCMLDMCDNIYAQNAQDILIKSARDGYISALSRIEEIISEGGKYANGLQDIFADIDREYQMNAPYVQQIENNRRLYNIFAYGMEFEKNGDFNSALDNYERVLSVTQYEAAIARVQYFANKDDEYAPRARAILRIFNINQ